MAWPALSRECPDMFSFLEHDVIREGQTLTCILLVEKCMRTTAMTSYSQCCTLETRILTRYRLYLVVFELFERTQNLIKIGF